MTITFIESPYFNRPDACRYLACCLLHCYSRGESPYASHALGPLALPENVRVEIPAYSESTTRVLTGRELGLAAASDFKDTLRLECVSFVVAFYMDLGWSQGMQAAKDEATVENYHIQSRTLEGQALAIWKAGKWPAQARLTPNHTVDLANVGVDL